MAKRENLRIRKSQMKYMSAFNLPSVPTSTGSDRLFAPQLQPIAIPKNYRPSSVPPVPDEFTEYESYNVAGWDGFDAQAISGETIQESRNLFLLLPRELRSVDIAPGADGTIGFEWRTGSGDQRIVTIIDVGPGRRVVARRLFATGKSVQYPETTVRTGAIALIRQLF
jgi:hypothetical protein